jgi:nicotinate-nucleotide adenylyltransferase
VVRGVFIGSFDPVHLGHVHFAVSMAEKASLDQILVIPAHISPFKLNRPPISGHHRLEMCQLAFQGWGKASILDVEICRPPPSFTIDTLRELTRQKLGPLRLLLGSEVARSLAHWKDAKEIIQLARPLVAALRESADPHPWAADPISQELSRDVMILPEFDVSSTEVRSRLAQGQWCGHLLPQRVLDYIHHHHLYTNEEL